MNIVGKSVLHIKFGEGVIVEQWENKMKVDFGSNAKYFVYPDAFEKFFQTVDGETEKIINKELEALNEIRKKAEYEKEVMMYKIASKNKPSFHGVFDLTEDEFELFKNLWSVSTVRNNKSTKVEIKLQEKLNMNSACILTIKEKGKKECERKIMGFFMPEEDFIGTNCISGVITAHEKYRIVLNCDEPIYFWDFFCEEQRLRCWSRRKLKYLPTITVQGILNRIVDMDIDDDLKEEIIDFHRYFSEVNLM